MAQRRMFTKSIVCSGKFLRMPPTSRLLYYDLCMSADDDGVSEAFSVMRLTGANEDDLKVLIAKEYVTMLDPEELVVHISAWTESNSIPQQKYKKSFYSDLLYEKTGILPKYAESIPEENETYTESIPKENETKSQYSIGKGRSRKVREDQEREVEVRLEKDSRREEKERGTGGREGNNIALLFTMWSQAMDEHNIDEAKRLDDEISRNGFSIDHSTRTLIERK